MKRLDSFISWWTAIVASGLASAGFLVREWLKSHGFGDSASLLAIAILVLAGIKLGEGVARACVDGVQWVRRLILGDSFVEGSWVDLNIDESTRTVRAVSIVRFGYSDRQLTFGGEVFSTNGVAIGNFDTSLCRLDRHVLWYIYAREVTFERREATSGRGKISFSRASSVPDSYYGSFYDPQTTTEVSVRGQKLTDRESLRLVGSQVGRRDVAKRELQRFLDANSGFRLLEIGPRDHDSPAQQQHAADGAARRR